MRSATPLGGCEPALRFVPMLGRAPRPYALPVELARRRRRLPRPLARDQDRVRQVVADRRTAIGGYTSRGERVIWQRRYLGAHNPRPAGFRPPFRLHLFQSDKARFGRASGGLAVLDVSPLRCQRTVSKRLGGRCWRTGSRRRATVTAGAHTDRRRNALRCSALRLLFLSRGAYYVSFCASS